jgi:hypothetical protein
MTKARSVVEGFEQEFSEVSLGDSRLDERLARIASLVGLAPDDSFPEQMDSDADQEALYRFLSNPKVTMEAVLAGHVSQTHERMKGRRVVRVAHDTSSFRFDGDREGLGILKDNAKGFHGHFALALAADETREPLGVLGVRPYVHKNTEARRQRSQAERVTLSQRTPRSEKESSRWEKLAIDVNRAMPEGVDAIHVMDQEADDYTLLGELCEENLRFVVRADPQRNTAEDGPLADVLEREPATLFRTVALNPRSERAAKGRHVVRKEREATLHIRWGTVTLRRGQYSQCSFDELSLFAVHVFEPNPPTGEAPIEWMLLTSEEVTSLEHAKDVVDHYRARWVIEEYFKALKTGCAFEKRQLTSYQALVRALSLFVPLAWRLLILRHLGRAPEERPASAIFDAEQLLLLALLLKKRRRVLPDNPSVRDAMLGIAALGGHIKNNGDPGWIVLGRGHAKFSDAEVGWRLARGCDQS